MCLGYICISDSKIKKKIHNCIKEYFKMELHTVNLVLVRTVKNNYFSLCTN